MIRGKVDVNGSEGKTHELLEFEGDHPQLNISTAYEGIILLGDAVPFYEPIVAHGPFLMNSYAEIQQAYADYRRGEFESGVSSGGTKRKSWK